MRRALVTLFVLPILLAGLLIGVSHAQTVPPSSSSATSTTGDAGDGRDIEDVLVNGTTEWMIGGAFGIGIGRRVDADNSSYAFQALSWGRVLTRPVGPAFIRGRFEWAAEVIPIFGQWEPDRAVGVGITPLVWRWNLQRRGRVAGFVEVGGGGLWTNTEVPAGTSGGNFTAQGGAGIRMLTRRDRGVVLAYRFHHISNGNRVDRNPGVNAHVVYFGWTFLRPQRGPA